MADTKLTGLSGFTPVLTDILYGVDDPSGTPISGKVTFQQVLTLFEGNIALPTSAVTSGTFADARISESSVTQHQAALAITESQISDLGSYLTAADIASGTITARADDIDFSGGTDGDVLTVQADGSLALEAVPAAGSVAIDDITDITITTPADKELLAFDNGSGDWINQTAAEAGLAAASHSHTLSDISDSGAAAALGVTGADANAVTGTAGTSGDLATWNVDGDLVDGPTPPSGTIVGTTDTQTLTNKNLADATNTYRAASTTVTGAVELADVSETSAGTDTGRAVTPDALAGSVYGTEVVTVCLFDDSEDVATGDGAGDQLLRIPSKLNGWDLVAVAAYVQTAGTTGTTDIQIHNVTDAVDMLSTKLTIDSAETDSSTATAAVINTSNDSVATADKIRFDVDAVSTTAPKGLWVELQFRAP